MLDHDRRPDLASYLSRLTLAAMLDELETPGAESSEGIRLYDGMPAVVAQSLMQRLQVARATVDTDAGPLPFSAERLEAALEQRKRAYLRSQLDWSEPQIKALAWKELPSRIKVDLEVQWAAAKRWACQNEICYRCEADGYYFTNNQGQCPFNRNHPVEAQPTTSECCP